MKVGTDGVLVGAWASLSPDDHRILDIGTGTGLIALMLAQRTETRANSGPREPASGPDRPGAESGAESGGKSESGTPSENAQSSGASAGEISPSACADPPCDTSRVRITGIDIGDVTEARENAAASPWGHRVELLQCPVQEFRPDVRYDLIVSNPPFFVDALTCPDAGRTTARHTVELPFEALRDSVCRLLAEEGRFAAILPVEEGRLFERICRGRLFVSRRTEVRTTPRRAPKRVLLEFVRQAPAEEVRTGQLTIGTGAHETYTPEYRTLTRDFYLKF